jgi:DNA helicase II / ATP-dependent DNA helicase PcrA
MNISIVVKDEVWKFIISTDVKFSESLRKCINKIKGGKYDYSLRVKKLKGASRLVWEARIDKVSRLLFTYRQTHNTDGNNQMVIALEAVCQDHDDVVRKAKAIDIKWWDGEEIQVLGSLDQSFASLSILEQNKIQLWENEELELKESLKDELQGNTKWLVLKKEIIQAEKDWQEAIISGLDLRLKLTQDENEIIEQYGNVLLSGNAGTGKTTVGLYRLAKAIEAKPMAKCLYVAYNQILIKESQEQFKQILKSSDKNLVAQIEFITIKDLCFKIIHDSGEEINQNLVGYLEFYARYSKKPESKKFPPILVWDEIRSIIKGSNINAQFNCYLLSQKEYDRLGKNRSEVFGRDDRHEIYKLAEWYQKYLNSEKNIDEIDLARAALLCSKKHKINPYDMVVCDEVQDFTEIQVEILIKSLSHNGQILCAGDVNQIISPSGFRWEDMKKRLYQQNLRWTSKLLPFNFRSTSQLVSLSLKLLHLKSQFIAEPNFNESKPSISSGELARLIKISNNDVNHINLGASDAILVRTVHRKEEIRKSLNTKLVFTVEESKGLEFDTVYLFEFFEFSHSLWKDALQCSQPLKSKQKAELRLEFNLLYVAITRARRLLNICEQEISNLWINSEISDSCIPMSAEEAFNQARYIDTHEWYTRAKYYQKAQFFPQAIECAIKSGNDILKQDIQIEYFLSAKKYIDAAQLMLEMKRYSDAGEIFESISKWYEASLAWDSAKNYHRNSICQAKHLVENGEEREAVKLLINIENYAEAAEILESLHDWKEAASIWQKAGNQAKFNECQDRNLKLENQNSAKTTNIVNTLNHDRYNTLNNKIFIFETSTIVMGRETVTQKEAYYCSEILDEDLVLDMVCVHGGTFLMGSPFSPKTILDEAPQHKVTIQDFFLGKYLVTQRQWEFVASLPRVKKALDHSPSQFKGDCLPVESVSWSDAIEFCARISNFTGHQYRLPSEAEWEYACRAGTTTPFYFGETINTKLANYDGRYDLVPTFTTVNEFVKREFRNRTSIVGLFPPNAFGIYDMHGNLNEWCADRYHNNYKDAPNDGSIWMKGGSKDDYVLRGGSWYDSPNNCRSTSRARHHDGCDEGGFRVVCDSFNAPVLQKATSMDIKR